MMSKLNDLTLEKEKLLKTKQLEPLNKNIAAKKKLPQDWVLNDFTVS